MALHPARAEAEREGGGEDTPEPGSGTPAGAPKAGRAEKEEQRREWEAIVFAPEEVDRGPLVTPVLEELFSSPEAKKALEELRESMERAGQDLRRENTLGPEEVRGCINSLLAADQLQDDQANTLREIASNEKYLAELADVLNAWLASIDSWSWGMEFLPLEMRRHLNGKYRVVTREDAAQALFLHDIGMWWALNLKKGLRKFADSLGWRDRSRLQRRDRERRSYFLGEHQNRRENKNTIQTTKRSGFLQRYFMSQLPDSMQSGAGRYDDADIGDYSGNAGNDPRELKQSLLRLIATDGILGARLDSDFVVWQTDFRWLGPSLPHSALFATLKLFGVSDFWINFFRTFLQTPVRFVDQGPATPVRKRQRGVPMFHALSDFMSECMLFCLDCSVNRATAGVELYRLHDDFWSWGRAEECKQAWQATTQLAKVMGFAINEDKTGTGKFVSRPTSKQQQLPKALPSGPTKWGFLKLDHHSGRFIID